MQHLYCVPSNEFWWTHRFFGGSAILTDRGCHSQSSLSSVGKEVDNSVDKSERRLGAAGTGEGDEMVEVGARVACRRTRRTSTRRPARRWWPGTRTQLKW